MESAECWKFRMRKFVSFTADPGRLDVHDNQGLSMTPSNKQSELLLNLNQLPHFSVSFDGTVEPNTTRLWINFTFSSNRRLLISLKFVVKTTSFWYLFLFCAQLLLCNVIWSSAFSPETVKQKPPKNFLSTNQADLKGNFSPQWQQLERSINLLWNLWYQYSTIFILTTWTVSKTFLPTCRRKYELSK